MRGQQGSSAAWWQSLAIAALGPLAFLIGLVLLQRSALVAVPAVAFWATSLLVVAVPGIGRRCLRDRVRHGRAPPALPPWRQVAVVYALALLVWATLLSATL